MAQSIRWTPLPARHRFPLLFDQRNVVRDMTGDPLHQFRQRRRATPVVDASAMEVLRLQGPQDASHLLADQFDQCKLLFEVPAAVSDRILGCEQIMRAS